MFEALRLSLMVSLMATIVVAIVGTAVAYLLARRRFFGRDLLDALVSLPLVLPPTVTGYYLIILLGRRGWFGKPLFELTGITIAFSLTGAVIAAVVMALPLMVRSARAAFENVDRRYEIAAYTLGKGKLETLLRITIPLAGRGLFAGVLLSFARALGEFGATLMIAGNLPGRTRTMPLAIYDAVISGEENRAQLMVLVMTTISVLAVWLTNRLTGNLRFRETDNDAADIN